MNYQLRNSAVKSLYERIIYDNFSFGAHLHRFLEIAYVLEGELQIIINEKEDIMHPGEMALIFPNTIHEYKTHSQNKVAVFVISDNFIPSVSKKLGNVEADSYVFKPEKPVLDFWNYSLIHNEHPEPLTIKAATYAVVQAFMKTHELRKKQDVNGDLVHKILCYVAEHYQDNITLQALAKELGYNQHYLSNIFNSALHINFRLFLNFYRIDHACMLLRETNMDITSISMECGFQSIRNFNRTFLQLTNEQPLKYRQRFQK